VAAVASALEGLRLKWLLITTLGTNPGDEFARIGVQNLIRDVDPKAEFDLLNKEDPAHYYRRDFDRAVICGMPLFWSLDQDNYDIWWWDQIFGGWIAKDRRKLMAMGVGHVVLDDIPNFAKYVFSINYVIQNTWALTFREPIMDHPKVMDSICPSAFAVKSGLLKKYQLCNFMLGSGHFQYAASKDEYESWMSKQETISACLRNTGFKFVAHTMAEVELARNMGWKGREIFYFANPEGYLDLYSQTGQYFGHRLHGAAVVAAAGGSAWGVAYDSRVKMVQRLGGYACKPSKVLIDNFRDWVNGVTGWAPVVNFNIEQERVRLTRLLYRFAHDK
jgi:hypothetical protein